MPLTTDQFTTNHRDVMVVDDNPVNLTMLEEILLGQGHAVRLFPLGRLALAAAMRNPPDLILLDVNMPEMNGFEVCERLKSTEALSDVPVIFLSALTDIQDKVKAFSLGAADYVSKPFQFEEVQARVETQLKLHRLKRALKAQNEDLEDTVTERTRELATANVCLAQANERLTILDHSKSEFLSLISHEFRTPLSGLFGASEIILEGMAPTEENQKLQALYERSRRRILSLLDDALLLTEIDVSAEQFRFGPVSLQAALSSAIERTTQFAESRGVALIPPPAGADLIIGHEELLIRALQALLETAVKFSERGSTLLVSHEVVMDSPRVIIESSGRTIPTHLLARFFDLLSIGEPITPGGDLGLGPPMAHRILSLFGAWVTVANRDPSGIRIAISLKRS